MSNPAILLAMTLVVGLAVGVLLYVAYPSRDRRLPRVLRWLSPAMHAPDPLRRHTIPPVTVERRPPPGDPSQNGAARR